MMNKRTPNVIQNNPLTTVVYRGGREDLQGQSFDVPAEEKDKAGYIEREADRKKEADRRELRAREILEANRLERLLQSVR